MVAWVCLVVGARPCQKRGGRMASLLWTTACIIKNSVLPPPLFAVTIAPSVDKMVEEVPAAPPKRTTPPPLGSGVAVHHLLTRCICLSKIIEQSYSYHIKRNTYRISIQV